VRIAVVELHSFVADWLQPGSVVVDLGVNTGGFSMHMINEFGCTVFGAEPLPDLVQALPSDPLLHVAPIAISDGASEVDLHINRSRCASVNLAEVGAQTIRVPAWTFEQLLDHFAVHAVDLLKVDIEGAEIPLFDSTRDELLLRCQQMTVEFHDFLDPRLASDVERVCRRLECLGFDRINFSRFTRGDVLFINPSRHLGRIEKAAVVVRDKYLRGIARRTRRLMRP
jgi:FkbM family methyltransferase